MHLDLLRTGSSFYWLFLFWLLLFSASSHLFHLSVLSEVWLLNFLRKIRYKPNISIVKSYKYTVFSPRELQGLGLKMFSLRPSMARRMAMLTKAEPSKWSMDSTTPGAMEWGPSLAYYIIHMIILMIIHDYLWLSMIIYDYLWLFKWDLISCIYIHWTSFMYCIVIYTMCLYVCCSALSACIGWHTSIYKYKRSYWYIHEIATYFTSVGGNYWRTMEEQRFMNHNQTQPSRERSSQ